MTLIQALILGTIQGITEFLPISSSGHLILVPYIFGWKVQSLTFDVALHLGTLLSLILVFYREWFSIIRNKRYLTLLLVGTLPAAVIGFLLDDFIENHTRSPLVASFTLIFIAALMFLGEKFGRKNRGEESLEIGDVLLIGLAQALALIPGVSRSGITITAGLFRNLKRDSAAEFSFILGTPIILGAGITKMGEWVQSPIVLVETKPLGVGLLTATLVGFFTIRYLLGFLKTHTLTPFVWYRVVLGFTILFISGI